MLGSLANLIKDEDNNLVSKLIYEELGFIQPSEFYFKATSKTKILEFEEKIFEMAEGGTKLCRFTKKKEFLYADPEEGHLLSQINKDKTVILYLPRLIKFSRTVFEEGILILRKLYWAKGCVEDGKSLLLFVAITNRSIMALLWLVYFFIKSVSRVELVRGHEARAKAILDQSYRGGAKVFRKGSEDVQVIDNIDSPILNSERKEWNESDDVNMDVDEELEIMKVRDVAVRFDANGGKKGKGVY